ncbi:putative phosphatidate phosphatase [Thrips palmi]|uniref:Phosphatidate phosphatase n=1 Tax=Thrips palmi TaxID=161013 RepID=A0A6P8YHG9_THRPL|nr:putative phosphatidate phosphatase [Thrips palmi]
MPAVGINVRKVVFETAVVLAVGLAVLMLRAFAKPHRRGFFCHDESIRFPKLPDTISDTMVALGTLGIPTVLIGVVEVLRTGRGIPSGLSWRGAAVPLWAVRVYRQNGVFILGAGLTELTADLAKNYVGRLRPNFLAACNPVTSGDASSFAKLCAAATPGNPVYVAPGSYYCLGDPDDEKEARASFPSAHSVLAFYAAVYLVLFVQARGRRLLGGSCALLRPLLQWLLLLAAWWIALSRIVDHMHHPGDVLAGATIGTIFACLQVFLVSGLFGQEKRSGEQLVVLGTTTKTYSQPNCV